MGKSYVFLLVTAILGLLLTACTSTSTKPISAESMSTNLISQKLICQCSCETRLNNCEPNCTFDDKMLELITHKLIQNQSEDDIIQYFIYQYGEKVLAPIS